ncbi:PIR protein [Plasmodium yoelii]|uniref:PIR protein n=2 Tax=Plasmodium yoelii TaxID=5861 RepID=A0AAF0B107_PLAYO|nr:PIR protein [Plasmodium yoelii]WBY54406.1 PIR protein [Plasmodium yoelii yoelii]CDS44232.1 YIR protein [Plasmodium yoelii]VTZ71425.1 PIR protein [Plasmodium yoelii]|eukprot:XP_022811208.1 PIR protein [Plasmodium yoelii]
MNKQVCEKFESVWDKFPDELDSDNKYQFKTENFLDSYCFNNECKGDLDKINAGFFYFLNQFIGSSWSSYYAQNNINIVDYIILWLSYMLNLKPQVGNVKNLEYFYSTTINNDRYKNSIPDVTDYKNYKDLIDQKKYFLGMDKNIIFNFYEVFKLICEMYTNFNETRSHCSICSQNANKFVNKYKEMNKNSVITSNSSYNKLLSTLSNEYINFKNYYTSKCSSCKDIPSLPSVEKIQSPEQFSGQGSEDTPSSSSITSKLFTVLSIFGAIGFFLGISYKYSLFGFRKRFQKQKLREKIKNIKKKMNH